MVCGTESRKFETFLDLSLDMPLKNGKEWSIADCLQRYTEVRNAHDSECIRSNEHHDH